MASRSFSALLLLICATQLNAKEFKLKIKSEVNEKEGDFNLVQVEFETGSRVEVTWCRVLRENEDECIPVADDKGYQVGGKLSLFYFMYMGTTSLRKRTSEDAVAFKVTFSDKADTYRYTHVIRVPEAEISQSSRQAIAVPKVVSSPSGDNQHPGGPLHLTCSIQSGDNMKVTWLFQPGGSAAYPFAVYEDGVGSQSSDVSVDVGSSAGSNGLTHKTTLDIKSTSGDNAGQYACSFSSRETGDSITLHATFQ